MIKDYLTTCQGDVILDTRPFDTLTRPLDTMYKKIALIMIAGVLLISLLGCSGKMSGMPRYISRECYYGEGFQDYTDYCKYYYNEETIEDFSTHTKFTKVTDLDIDNIISYFENFEKWVEYTDYYEQYDFDYSSQVKKDDYYYIYTKEGYDKFGYYDVYYVDMAKCILYFIHSNI